MKGDTITALCTAQGKGALSVLRVSGPQALSITKEIAGFLPSKIQSHRIYFGTLKEGDKKLDEVLIAYFQEGRSFTGEETLEIFCHGGEVYLDILKSLIQKGARPAERGEFSLQAFSNGKIDLIQAEALLQLIEGKTPIARSQALYQLKGELSKKFLDLEKQWLFLLSHIEADIDFSLENLKILTENQIQRQIQILSQTVQDLISKYQPFEKLQKGLSFGVFGASNAGKSSLFNALLEEERAIVSEEAGTTRDIVESQIQNPQEGLNILLKDSAGFRESQSQGEKKGQEKALQLFKECDCCLILLESLRLQSLPKVFLDCLKETDSLGKIWLVLSKVDLLDSKIRTLFSDKTAFKSVKEMCDKKNLSKEEKSFINQLKAGAIPKAEKIFFVSSLTGEGLSSLKEDMLACAAWEGDRFLISNSRHYKALMKMRESLEKLSSLKGEKDIMALELREGLFSLYEILGKQIEDQVLDHIFQRFCIGK